MAISPDGRTVLVSASTGNVVHAIDTATGTEAWRFESGDSPHENNYSADGRLIFHASIGLVYTPADEPALDASKGDRYFQVVDAETHQILKRVDMGQKLEEAGYPDMSSAVRPMALAPDEKRVYLQISFFHGFVEYDLEQDKVLRVVELPISEEAQQLRREDYLLDSAHHGIAINPRGHQAVRGRARCPTTRRSSSTATFAPPDRGPGQEAVLVDQQRRRPLLLHLVQRRRPRVGRLLRAGEGDRQHPRRRPPPAHAHRSRPLRLPRPEGRLHAPGRVTAQAAFEPGAVAGSRSAISEPARLRIVITRTRRATTARVVRRRAREGTNRLRLGRLRGRGRYRLELTATDEAGNSSPSKVLRFRIR